jgi:hypothetical protein
MRCGGKAWDNVLNLFDHQVIMPQLHVHASRQALDALGWWHDMLSTGAHECAYARSMHCSKCVWEIPNFEGPPLVFWLIPHPVHNGLDAWNTEINPLHAAASGVTTLYPGWQELTVLSYTSGNCTNSANMQQPAFNRK